MKEILLVCGLGGTIILIALAINKWGIAQKLKGVSGVTTLPNVSFLWKFTAALLLISIALAVKPEIVTIPWEQNKTATALTIALLLGLLIQWAVQNRESDRPTSGEGGTSSFFSSIFGVLVAFLLLAATYSCFQAGLSHQAERGLLASQGWRNPPQEIKPRIRNFEKIMVLKPGELSEPIKVDGNQDVWIEPVDSTLPRREISILRYYPDNGSFMIVTNRLGDDISHVVEFTMRLKLERQHGNPAQVEVVVGKK